MGYRTVVVLSNNEAHMWTKDVDLGSKIMDAGLAVDRKQFAYGKVVEQVHADTQSLIIADGYSGFAKAHTQWYPNQGTEQRDLELLQILAMQMGYTLRKMPKKG